VFAFEPHPKMFRILRRGARANVTTHAAALSDTIGDAELFIPGRPGRYSTQLASLRSAGRDRDGVLVRVPTRTLDSYDLRNIGFIKVDVEGHEQAVLRGARETIARDRPVLLLEMEPRHTGVPIAQSIAAVADLGYDLFFVQSGRLLPASLLAEHERAMSGDSYVFNFFALPADGAHAA
jgi:FkbM family methyltransferase